jgi:hypothetical protein
MDDRDSERLLDLLIDAYLAKGRPAEQVGARVVQAWIRTLPDVPVEHVERSLHYHARDPEYRHPPTPADVLQIIREHTGGVWPAADEAWAVAIRAMDEDATVVWFEEMAEAWGAAQAVMRNGDEVGARMAFRDTYRRLVHQAQEQGRKPRAWVSLGHDPVRREPAIQEAVSRGLLTADRAKAYLPAPGATAADVAGLLTGKVVQHPASAVAMKERLSALKSVLRQPKAPEEDPDKDAEIERKRKAAQAMARNQGGAA